MALENPFKGLSKTQLWISIAGFTGITGYLVVRHHASTGSWNPWSGGTAQDTTSTTQVDPVTGLPYSQDDAVDPVTGLTYLAEAEQYGSVQAAEADVSQFGTSAPTGSGVGVQPASPVAGSPSGTQAGSPYTSNAGWAKAVQAGLTDIGYDPQAVGAALGAYLTQEPLTPAQVQIVQTAIAEFGPPPVGNLQVIQAPPSGPAKTATVPDVKGMTVAAADSAIRAAGLTPGTGSNLTGTVSGQSPAAGSVVAPGAKVNLTVGSIAAAGGPGPVVSPEGSKPASAPAGLSATGHAGSADFGWHEVGGATHYELSITGAEAKDMQVAGTHAEHVALKAGRYRVKVRANSPGGSGPWSASKSFTVK
jgi:hypothetical protein